MQTLKREFAPEATDTVEKEVTNVDQELDNDLKSLAFHAAAALLNSYGG